MHHGGITDIPSWPDILFRVRDGSHLSERCTKMVGIAANAAPSEMLTRFECRPAVHGRVAAEGFHLLLMP